MATTWGGYRQACGIAHGLDLIGDRWALLVVRELLLGPKRFSDLRGALPGASPNALAARLRSLRGGGVVERRRLAPPAASQVYELTDWGRELEPILLALGTWALGSGSLDDRAFVSADSVMLTFHAYYRPSAGVTGALEVEMLEDDGTPRDRFQAVASSEAIAVARAPLPPRSDATVIGTAHAILAALGPRGRWNRVTVDGDGDLARALLAGVVVPGA